MASPLFDWATSKAGVVKKTFSDNLERSWDTFPVIDVVLDHDADSEFSRNAFGMTGTGWISLLEEQVDGFHLVSDST
jgi:hypothetical protein